MCFGVFMIFIILLFFLVIIISIGSIYKKEEQITALKKQIMLFSKRSEEENIPSKITFLDSSYKEGTTNSICSLYISPCINSKILRKVESNTKVYISSTAIIKNKKWFEITVPCEKNENNRGWIEENNLNLSAIYIGGKNGL